MDCFIGKNAAVDIYPALVGQLDAYNPAPAAKPVATPAS
jgi:hypothetical protein